MIQHSILSTTAGSAGNGYFEVADDLTSLFVAPPGGIISPTSFSVTNSVGNDGNYTVSDSTYNAATVKTRIFVTTNIPFSSVSNGSLTINYTPSYRIDFTSSTKPSIYIKPLSVNGPMLNVEGITESDDLPLQFSNTSLDLPGRGTPNYGELVLQNLVRITENFASSTEPPAMTKGQLWYDDSNNVLKLRTVDATSQPAWTNVISGTLSIIGHTHIVDNAQPLQNWNITHNLSTQNVNVQIYINVNGNLELTMPSSLQIIDLNNVIVQFTQPRSGRATIIANVDENTLPNLPIGNLSAGDGLVLNGTELNIGATSNFTLAPGSIDLSLVPGLIPGTYNSLVVNQYGRVVAGSNINYADLANHVPFTGITGKPTTVSGYGITDAVTYDYMSRLFTDVNLLSSTGFYNLQTTVPNAPPGSSLGNLISIQGGATGMQLLGGYTNDLWHRGWEGSASYFYPWRKVIDSNNFNSYVPTLTGAGASGTWPISITGNAATVSNGVYVTGAQSVTGVKQFVSSENPLSMATGSANALEVKAGATGAAMMSFYRPGSYGAYLGIDTDNQLSYGGWSTGAVSYKILHSGNFTSYVPTLTGTGASGTWPIAVSGAAASVPWTGVTGKPASLMAFNSFNLDANTMTPASMGFTYAINAPWSGPIVSTSTSVSATTGYEMQLNSSYTTAGNMSFRTRNGDTNVWNAWSTFLTTGNYTSYVPSVTGVGATGNWGINITGTAENVTTPTAGYKHLGAWGVARTAVGAILVNTSYMSDTSAACSGNSYSATYLTATQQINTITGVSTSMSMSQDTGATRGSFIARAAGTGDANLAGMTFWNDAYAIKMGVRADGYLGIGGGSRAAWSWYTDPAGNMTAAGNVTSYSDPRLKENFKIINDPFTILNALDGGTFTWKHGYQHTEVKAGKRDYGVLADQVEAVMPEIITESIELDGESYKTVAYEKLIPVLLEAVKSLKAEVTELQRKLDGYGISVTPIPVSTTVATVITAPDIVENLVFETLPVLNN